MIPRNPITVPIATLATREALSLKLKIEAAALDVEGTGSGRVYRSCDGDSVHCELLEEVDCERGGVNVIVVAMPVELLASPTLTSFHALTIPNYQSKNRDRFRQISKAKRKET